MIRYIEQHKDQFGVEALCRVLHPAVSGFITSRGYRAAKIRSASARQLRDDLLTPKVVRLHAENYSVYGRRQIHTLMRRQCLGQLARRTAASLGADPSCEAMRLSRDGMGRENLRLMIRFARDLAMEDFREAFESAALELMGPATAPIGFPLHFETDTAWNLVRTAHLVGLQFIELLSEVDLSPTEFAVLMHLDEMQELTQAELARKVLVRPQSIGALVNALTARGLLVRDGPGGRGRRAGISVTSEGGRP